MDPISIHLSGSNFRKICVPDLICAFFDPDSMGLRCLVRLVKQTEFYCRGVLRKECEIDALSIPSSSQWIWMTG
jgi:hypothetical protein